MLTSGLRFVTRPKLIDALLHEDFAAFPDGLLACLAAGEYLV